MIFNINEPRSSKSPPVNVKGRASHSARHTVKYFENKEDEDKEVLDQDIVPEVDANLEQTLILN